MTEAVGVGLVGLGTIGTGVVKVLAQNADVIEKRLGFPLRLVRVADLDTETDRGVDLSGIRFDADAEGLIGDPAVHIVVELIGGYDAARRLTLRAIEQGRHVVTANKRTFALVEAARTIKCAEEILCMNVALAVAEDGMARMRAALRPGITETELWTHLWSANVEAGGDWIECRLLASGNANRVS